MRERTAGEPLPAEPTTASRVPLFETARSPKLMLAVAFAHCAMPFALYLTMPTFDVGAEPVWPPIRRPSMLTVMPLPKSRVPSEADIDQPQKKEPSVMVRQELILVGIP